MVCADRKGAVASSQRALSWGKQWTKTIVIIKTSGLFVKNLLAEEHSPRTEKNKERYMKETIKFFDKYIGT